MATAAGPYARGVDAARQRFDDLYPQRRASYAKDPSDEAFLVGLNEYLATRELELYEDYDVEYPFFFVVGLPRSGTTLLSQLLAYCLDVGYVTNVAARFWRAPVHGIRLSQLFAGATDEPTFASDYARTKGLRDIHEFGYFWRYWLRKETFDDVVHAQDREGDIDWSGLRLTLANMQQVFDRGLVAKNMLGAYHMPRLLEVLRKVVFVYIERDPLDVAVSILDARRKYYGDPSTWWSYVPLEYPLLKDLGYRDQIAGQIHYLTRFYDRALAEVGDEAVVKVRYDQLCADPQAVLDAVAGRSAATYGYSPMTRRPPPRSFPLRRHLDRDGDKQEFAPLLARLHAEDG
jgi:hypothetical protein